MALQSQLMPLPFQTGISEKTDSRWLDVGAQSTVINGEFVKGGAIQKRHGYAALSKTALPPAVGSITGLARLTSLGTGLFCIDTSTSSGSHINSYSPTLAQWSQLDNISECNAWRDGVAQWTTATTCFDVAYGNGYVVVVWCSLPRNTTTAYAVYCSVIDWSTGVYVYNTYEVASGAPTIYSHARVIIQGTTAVVCYKDATNTTDLYAIALNMGTMTWGAASKIISDYDPGASDQGFWDIAPITSGTEWVILYPKKVAGVSKSIVRKYTTALALSASTADIGPPGGRFCPGHGFAVSASSSFIRVAIVYDDAANEAVYASTWVTSSMAAGLAETNTNITFTGTAATKIAICSNAADTVSTVVASNNSQTVGARYNTMTNAGAAGAVVHQVYGMALEGKPFVQGGRTYCMLGSLLSLVAYTGSPPVSTVSNQGAYMLFDLNELDATAGYTFVARPVANLAPRIANTTNSTLQGMQVATGAWAVSSTQWLTLGSVVSSTSNRFGLQAFTFDFAGDRWNGCELGDVRYFPGGVPCMFDGKQVTELGFFHPPPTIGLAQAGGGALTALGAYTYLVVYTWVDANGNIQRSASSIGSGTLTAGNTKFTVTVTNCEFTLRQDPGNKYNPPIGIQVYRNIAGGATFYQMFTDSAVLVSDPNSTTQSFIDTMSDASLAALGYGIWPYLGGALEGYCPPAMTKMTVYNLRLWGVGDDRRTLWYSSALVEGETPRFSDSWRMPTGGQINGLEVMDNVLYVLQDDGILRISGNGPNEENTQNDLQGPDIVPSDAGCIEPRSVISTPMGIFFQAPAGIYLLTRGGEPMYVGQAVEDTLATYPVIKAVTHVAAKSEVRFEAQTAEASESGVCIVYNYLFKAWSIFKRYDADTTLASCPAVSSLVVNNTYYWATTLGRVYQESTTSFLDGSQWVMLQVESAWAKADGIAGWGRFRYVNLIAQRVSPHDLTISVATDYITTYAQSGTFTALQMSAWTTPLEHAEIQVGQQKASALRVRISDAAPTGVASTTGAGPILVGLQLDVGVLGRVARIPPTQGA